MIYFEISDTAYINMNFLSMEFVMGIHPMLIVSLHCVVGVHPMPIVSLYCVECRPPRNNNDTLM